MKIDKNTAVTLQYSVFDGAGRALESGKAPMAYLHGGYGNIFLKIEEALQGQEAGFATTVTLAPADAFGEIDEGLLQVIPKTDFPPGIKVGGQIKGTAEDGREHMFYVSKIKGAQVHLDGNHPHAGKTLMFKIKVLKVRAALDVEIAHGHVHGEGGHHH